MLKYFHLLLLISFTELAAAQQVIYKPIIIDQCTDSIVNDVCFWLKKDGIFYNTNKQNGNTFSLPSVGIYYLAYDFNDSVRINIPNLGINIDTLFNPKIELANYVSNPPYSEYLSCEKPAHGVCIDYYNRNSIRKIGLFEKGQLLDTLKTFYITGQLKEITYITKKLSDKPTQTWPFITKRFYINGNLQEYQNTEDGIEQQFFENGKEKKRYFYDSDAINYLEYYETGMIRMKKNNNSLFSYFPNGEIKYHMKRISKWMSILNSLFSLEELLNYDLEIHEYDSTGTLVKTGLFNTLQYEIEFPSSFSEIPLSEHVELLYETNPRKKEKYQTKYLLVNGKYIHETTISTFELSNNNWILTSTIKKNSK